MSGLSCGMWDLLLRCMGSSLVVPRGPSCPAACGISVPQPAIELMSPALEGRFLTPGPPGKSLPCLLDARSQARTPPDAPPL